MRAIFNILLFAVLLSCNNKDNVRNDDYTLSPSEDCISIPIDDNTSCYSTSIFTHTTSKGVTYLTMENTQTNELAFYNLDSLKLSKKIKIDQTGPNGIGRIMGHYVIDLENILVYSVNRLSICKIDGSGKLLNTYNLQSNSDIFVPHPPVSKIYNPIVKIDSCIYLYQALMNKTEGYDGDELEKYPLCIEINLKNEQAKTLPLTYPRLWESKNVYNKYTASRDYDGENFIYSFFISDFIHVTSDNKIFKKYDCRSKYTKGQLINYYTPDINAMKREDIENASYGSVVYDKYRKVYYRFFYPKCELDKNEDISILSKTKKEFSIIILDSKFNIIGESLFPENRYIPEMFFVTKDGLYLSENNFKSSSFDENTLVFRRLELNN